MKIVVSEGTAQRFGDEIRGVAPEARLVTLGPEGRFEGDPSGVDVFFFSIDLTFDRASLRETMALLGADSLRWVQGPGAGVDHPVWGGLLDRGVRLTNASGVHAEPIAQYVFTYVLHWEKQVARHRAQQAAREWSIIVSGDLTARTIGIVGLGGIGSATARIARAFGMRVLGLRRSPGLDPNVDRHLRPQELHTLLEESDYVVLCLPLTPETERLIGASELAAMGPDAVLVNVARGGVVDEPALVEALENGRIRGATLDVTAEEPLPPDSPLWTLDRCVLTPHDAGYSPRSDERLARLFVENLARFTAGEPLRNEIRVEGRSDA